MADDELNVEELRRELALKTRESRVLQKVSAEVNSTLKVGSMLDLVLVTLDEVFGFKHSMFLLHDEAAGMLRVSASHGYEDSGIGAEVKVGTGVIGQVAKKRRMMRVNNLSQQRQYMAAIRARMQQAGRSDELKEVKPLPGLADSESQIAIPLVVKDSLIGVFAVETQERSPYDEEDEVLVSTVANLIAAALHNAQLYETLEDKVRDRTQELEQANVELRDTQAQLVQSGKMAALGKLVAGVAHELNTPLASVASSRDTLARGVQKLKTTVEKDKLSEKSPRVKQLLGAIEEATRVIDTGADQVNEIVKRLRSFARLDEAELKRVDLNDSLSGTLAMLRAQHQDRIRFDLRAGPIPEVTCNARMLNQVFMSLLENAVQAIPDGQSGQIEVSTEARGDRVVVRVRDDGEGIAPENLSKIWDPGFTTRGVGVGTGLGLSIAFKIVADHGGSIRVDSEVGKGAVFEVEIGVDATHSGPKLAPDPSP